ncbi:type IV secretion protein IcmD [Tatlockia sp. PL877]|uniref:type IV secretion protein IcmD n=1 Tax=Legionella sp. W10-070 TaxID=1117709 RepID=UPI001F5E79DB|nr:MULTISPECIES: type IV secretion protein IcmD [unclassified Legionella]MDI9817888.1 type IV secretion protein IcmD [Legionella sp. PL877]
MVVFAGEVAAAGKTLGNMATSITNSFTSLAKLITAGSYLAGLGFSIGAIMKFKQHKDNPTQIPIGTPVALVFIAAALLFLPSILGVTGQTMFGEAGTVAGPTGTIIGTPGGG